MPFEWFKKATEKAKAEIDAAVSDKLMEEELNPTLRQHKGEPIRKKDDKK